jgi:hypothetical protein
MGLTSSLHACFDITPQKIDSIQDVDTLYQENVSYAIERVPLE